MARVPHRLYGYLDAAERGSVGRWRALALAEIAAAHRRRRLADRGRRHRALSACAATWAGRDPADPAGDPRRGRRALPRRSAARRFASVWRRSIRTAAARLPPGDRQRLMRAFEVVRATGTPIGAWQAGSGASRRHTASPSILLMPPREALYAACDARFAR